ncbi:MAG: PIG-L family deacetylase, partial [Verrucomicrobiota bacterium]
MNILENPASWERVLIFAPHPDDESLGAGGLVQRAVHADAKVRVVFLTNGDNNPWPQRVIERRWKIQSKERVRWGERRQKEALAALGVLGVPADCVRFLNLPDQGVTALLLSGDEVLPTRISREIAEFKPKVLITPALTDIHRDHNAFAVLLQLAINRQTGEELQFTECNFVIHRKRDGSMPGAEFQLRLSSDEQETKRRAIRCHATQMKLSSRRFLKFARVTETFAIRPEPVERDETHPVKAARVDAENLRLELARGSIPSGIFGKRILYVIADGMIGGPLHRSMTLPARSALINVMDSASGAIVTQGAFRNSGGTNEVSIPLSALAGARRIFVKLENRFRFYDAAGWREIVLKESADENLSTLVFPAMVPPRVCCVFPCYNVSQTCGEVLRRVADRVDHVIAVNDGSTDGTESLLRAVAAESDGRIQVISYPDNRGKGVALLEGFRLAL